MTEQVLVDRPALPPQLPIGGLQISRIPENDGRDQQIEPGHAEELVLEGPVYPLRSLALVSISAGILASNWSGIAYSEAVPILPISEAQEYEQLASFFIRSLKMATFDSRQALRRYIIFKRACHGRCELPTSPPGSGFRRSPACRPSVSASAARGT